MNVFCAKSEQKVCGPFFSAETVITKIICPDISENLVAGPTIRHADISITWSPAPITASGAA
jgi:hypothetical protein